MQTSARNQYTGRITRLTKGAVNGEVVIDLPGGDSIVSVITNASIDRLGLVVGGKVTALIKASAAILMVGEDVATSARNCLCGAVKVCREGAVNGEVILTLAGGNELAVVVTNESIRKLGLAAGVKACGLVKASNVVLAVE